MKVRARKLEGIFTFLARKRRASKSLGRSRSGLGDDPSPETEAGARSCTCRRVQCRRSVAVAPGEEPDHARKTEKKVEDALTPGQAPQSCRWGACVIPTPRRTAMEAPSSGSLGRSASNPEAHGRTGIGDGEASRTPRIQAHRMPSLLHIFDRVERPPLRLPEP